MSRRDARESKAAEASIVGGDIVIRLPIRNIPIAVEGAEDHQAEAPMRVTNAMLFARYVVEVLNDEDELGTTMIHAMFDEAFWEAGADGAEGVEYGTIDDDGNAVFPVKGGAP